MGGSIDKSAAIIVVGGGTWGCSTALHLARRGYTNVVVLDPYPVPSTISAGNDVNKIIEQGLPPSDDDRGDSHVWAQLLYLAGLAWSSDPIFSPYYHPTGFILSAHTPSVIAALRKRENVDNDPSFTPLNSPEDFRRSMPEGVLTGEFPEWKGWWKRKGAGWVHARKAMVSAAREAERLGVRFVGGVEGDVIELIKADGHGDVVGVRTKDGKIHHAERVILAAGANCPNLLDFKNQLRPTAWTLAHIKIQPNELSLYKNLPVLFNIEKGFFMEPDEDKHELKICDEHPGYCNWVGSGTGSSRQSIPFAKKQIPKASEDRVRSFLRDIMPQLADRPLVAARLCWCADTPNRMFLISYHPEYPSLLIAAGGSGHGYMHIPTVGGFVVDAMEGKLSEEFRESFRWRPETAVDRDWEDTQGRFGGPNKVMNLADVKEWTHIEGSFEDLSQK